MDSKCVISEDASDEFNSMVYKYLCEQGYKRSAEAFKGEIGKSVKESPGDLKEFFELYGKAMEPEADLNETAGLEDSDSDTSTVEVRNERRIVKEGSIEK